MPRARPGSARAPPPCAVPADFDSSAAFSTSAHAVPSGYFSSPRRATISVRRRGIIRSEEHTSELQSRSDLVCRLLLEKKKYVLSSRMWINQKHDATEKHLEH